LSFVSTKPVVRVAQSQPFFYTDPVGGKIISDDSVRLKARFDAADRSYSYGWAYSSSAAGPFTLLGGSATPEYFWDEDNKPVGTYYLRLKATSTGTERSLTFISPAPVLFVSKNNQPGNEFAVPSTSSPGSGVFPF